jgi:hypothetical protein
VRRDTWLGNADLAGLPVFWDWVLVAGVVLAYLVLR